MRADQLLVRLGLAASRTVARRMIDTGRVRVDGVPIDKASAQLAEDAAVSVSESDDDRYVSRGGLKLAGALAATGVDCTGLVCLDVGQSTGGFSDCLLQAGAARVVGVDVGHGQLHPSLAGDPRLASIEGVNARSLDASLLGTEMPAGGFELIVIDVSFISLTLVLPSLAALAAARGRLLALVKPQFEVGRAGLDRRGLVKSTALYEGVRTTVTDCARSCGWTPLDWLDSPITGGDGNHEFFLHAQRTAA